MADVLDLITLTEAHSAINLPSSVTAQDVEIAAFITAVSRRFDAICGPVVYRTYTNELHDGTDTLYQGSSRLGAGKTVIRPRHTPVSTVITLVEYSGTTATTLTAESNTSKTSTDYLLETDGKHHARLLRRSSNGDAYYAAGRQNLVLTYLGGRVATTATVDANFKEAAALTLQHLWNSSAASWTRMSNFGVSEVDIGKFGQFTPLPPWDIPRAAKSLIADQLLPAFVG